MTRRRNSTHIFCNSISSPIISLIKCTNLLVRFVSLKKKRRTIISPGYKKAAPTFGHFVTKGINSKNFGIPSRKTRRPYTLGFSTSSSAWRSFHRLFFVAQGFSAFANSAARDRTSRGMGLEYLSPSAPKLYKARELASLPHARKSQLARELNNV